MGGICSSNKVMAIDIDEDTKRLLHRLHMNQKTIDILWHTFCKINKSKSKKITTQEFHDFYGIEETKFSALVFSRMDSSRSGNIDFQEYALAIWDYMTLDLNMFTFHLYDKDNSKCLNKSELDNITETVYGFKTGHNLTQDKRIGRMDSNSDGKITYDEFCTFVRSNSMIPNTAFNIRKEICDRNGGEDLWNEVKVRREQMFEDKSLQEILEVQNSTLN